jgi:recombinational DNA repair protein RecR
MKKKARLMRMTFEEAMNERELNVIERLKQENEQLRVALKMCNPCIITNENTFCYFCGFIGKAHARDCKYIELIGVENE